MQQPDRDSQQSAPGSDGSDSKSASRGQPEQASQPEKAGGSEAGSQPGLQTPGATGPRSGGKPPESPKPWALMGAGLEFAAAVGGLAFVGHLLDRHWGTDPALLITGAAVGLIGSMYNLWKIGKRYM